MAIASDDFILPLFKQVDLILNNFVYNGYQALVSYIQLPLGALVLLGVIILGWRTYLGMGNISLADYAKFVVSVGLIYMFAIHWGNFSQYVIDLFNKGIIDGMSSKLMDANPIQIPNANGLEGALQVTSTILDYIVRGIFSEVSWSNLSYIAYGTVIYLASWLMIGLIVLELILAKMIMALLFVISPIIIPMALFKRTETIFNNWIGSLVGHALLIIMISGLMGIFMSIVFWALPISKVSSVIPSTFYDGLATTIFPLLITMLATIFLTVKINSLAMQIGGGVSSGNSAGMIAGMMGGAAMAKGISSLLTRKGGAAAKIGGSVLKSTGGRAVRMGQSALKRMRRGQ